MIFDYRTQYHEYRRYLELLKQQARSPVAQVSLTIVGTLFLIGFLGMLAIRPTLATIADLTRSIHDEKRNIDLLDRKIRSLQLSQQKLESLRDRIPLLAAAVPETVDFTGIVRRIEILASEHRLAVVEFTHADVLLYPPSTPTVTIERPLAAFPVPVSLTVGGDEESLRRYIEDLERLDRVGRVTLVRLDVVPPKSRRERPFPLSATITMEFFTTQLSPYATSTDTTAKSTGDVSKTESSL